MYTPYTVIHIENFYFKLSYTRITFIKIFYKLEIKISYF